MSTNCIQCVTRKRTGPDYLCDDCRSGLSIDESGNKIAGGYPPLPMRWPRVAKALKDMKDNERASGRIYCQMCKTYGHHYTSECGATPQQPTCQCGTILTPQNSTKAPELFLCDPCAKLQNL